MNVTPDQPGNWEVGDSVSRRRFAGNRRTVKPPYQTVRVPTSREGPFLGGSCFVLLTYQLDGSVTDMLWLQRVQRIRVRSWRVGLRDCSHF